MKHWMITASFVALLATPAFALDVTNLDKIDHQVVFSSSGSQTVYTVGAGDTVYITGQSNGFLSLVSDAPKPSRGTLHSDGLLSGIIGAERTQDIPADSMDSFSIWPDGTLSIQGRKIGRRNH